jgi:DNA-binding IclR family transcriptional regulator
LTTHPQRAFTLSELSAALTVSPSSLSAVLQALMDSGYLLRHPRHKTYELGPVLVAVGRAAHVRHPVVELARPELARLAEEYGAECVGSVVVGDEIRVLALEGRPSQRTRGLSLGQRIPFAPPFGEIWVAYDDPTAARDWLQRVGDPKPDTASVAHLQTALAQVRARGYAVNLSTEQLSAYSDALEQLLGRPTSEVLRERGGEAVASLDAGYELLHAHPDDRYEVAMVIAPVFGPDGSVVFALTLLQLAERTGREIAQIGERLVGVGLQLTRAIGGHPPVGEPGGTAT